MRYSTFVAALVAPLCASASVMFTNGVVSLPGHEGMPVGRDVDFTWAGDGSPVDLALMRGPPASMNKVDDIALNVKGESNAAGQQSYKWTIPKDLPAGQYSASISQSGYTDYSPQFHVENIDAMATTTVTHLTITGGSSTIYSTSGPTTVTATTVTLVPSGTLTTTKHVTMSAGFAETAPTAAAATVSASATILCGEGEPCRGENGASNLPVTMAVLTISVLVSSAAFLMCIF